MVDTIDLGSAVAFDVMVDENGVWTLYNGGPNDKLVVARVDPTTDRVVGTIALDQAYGHFLFSFDDAIVAMTNETTDTIGNSVINVIDPATNTITRSVSLGERLSQAAGDGFIWASTGMSLERIDPRSGDVTGTWPLSSTGDALWAGAGGIWSVDAGGNATTSRWNPVLQAVDLTIELPTGMTPMVLATSPNSVWVLSFDGVITRVQLGTA